MSGKRIYLSENAINIIVWALRTLRDGGFMLSKGYEKEIKSLIERLEND